MNTSPKRIRDDHKAFRAAAGDLWPVAKGSPARVARPRARPEECAACVSGRRQPMWIFTYRQGGRLRCRYVPAEWAPRVRQAPANSRLAPFAPALISYKRAL